MIHDDDDDDDDDDDYDDDDDFLKGRSNFTWLRGGSSLSRRPRGPSAGTANRPAIEKATQVKSPFTTRSHAFLCSSTSAFMSAREAPSGGILALNT